MMFLPDPPGQLARLVHAPPEPSADQDRSELPRLQRFRLRVIEELRQKRREEGTPTQLMLIGFTIGAAALLVVLSRV